MKSKLLRLLSVILICGGNCFAQQPFNTRIIPTPQKVVKLDGPGIKITNKSESFCLSEKEPSVLEKKIQKCKKKHPETLIIAIHQVEEIDGAKNQSQAYRLEIHNNEVHLYYVDEAGYQYARKTLDQLDTLWQHDIPSMDITDWPALEWRGWLDDVSRGPIATHRCAYWQRDILTNFKMNFGSYYTEHSLYNPKYPDIVPQNDLVYAVNEGPMMANLQCFAHFEKTLRIPFYREMMDTKTNVNPASEKTYEFLKDQIANTMAMYKDSPFININCDETESLGAGRARDYVDKHGAADAYCNHINRVYELLKPYGKDVLMWGDIVGKDPTMLKKLPKEMQYIVWSYVAQDSYSSMIEPFKKLHDEQGTQFWVAPGVSHWSSIPQVRNYMKNIANLVRDGYQAGARGMINTAWDDSGESLFGDCWHAMAWSAEMAWHPIENTDPDMAAKELAERERIFNENYDRLFPAGITEKIYKVGDLASNEWVGDWFNTGALMQPLLNFYPSNVGDKMLERCDKVDLIVGDLEKELGQKDLRHFAYSAHRILAVSAKSRLKVLLHQALESGSDADIEQARAFSEKYFKQIHELKKEYLRLWDEEADAYSRDIICERYDQLGNEVLEAFNHVFVSTSSDSDGTPIVTMKTIEKGIPIYYTLDGRKPSKGSNLYSTPFRLERSAEVKTITYNEWDDSFVGSKYLLLHKGMGHLTSLGTQYSTYQETYSGGGDNALADGELGDENNYADGHWQGYWGEDIVAVYDFGKKTKIGNINMRFLQNTFDWILSPKTAEVYISNDGKNWNLVKTASFEPDFRIGGNRINDNAIRDLNFNTQHLKVVLKNPGVLPEWHPAHGQPSYIFCDEIVIE